MMPTTDCAGISAPGAYRRFAAVQYLGRFQRIVLQNTAASFIWADLRIAQRSPLRASYGIIGLHAWQTGYAVQVTAADGGGRQRNLTRRRRF